MHQYIVKCIICVSEYVLLFLQVRTGFMLNIIGILTINLGINTWGYAMFDMGTFPDWANATSKP